MPEKTPPITPQQKTKSPEFTSRERDAKGQNLKATINLWKQHQDRNKKTDNNQWNSDPKIERNCFGIRK
jgi:hypothetical protein